MSNDKIPNREQTESLLGGLRLRSSDEEATPTSAHVYKALEQNKREGLLLAVRARWVALAIAAVLLIMTNPNWDALYYYPFMAALAINGFLQLKAWSVGRNQWELMLLQADVLILTFALLYPNPFQESGWPTAVAFKFGWFPYLFVFLAATAMGFSWRTVFSFGTWTALCWLGGSFLIWWLGTADPLMSAALLEALNGDTRLHEVIDPNNVQWPQRLQEAILIQLAAIIIGVNGFRTNRLLLKEAEGARERGNLARYFPPTMVEQLADVDEPMGSVRSQNIAVLFADIVGFTGMAEQQSPQQVVDFLREFFRLVEDTVFQHGGTLDKYLGDGVMVTFGTPDTGDRDALSALECAEALLMRIHDCNIERQQEGRAPVRLSVGAHYGSAILGDIGSERRLEFATLGDTVNVASRIEALTREMDTRCIVSDELVKQATMEAGAQPDVMRHFQRIKGKSSLRGRSGGLVLWKHKHSANVE